MANYTKSTNFSVKDTLTTGDPDKIVSGAEIDTEFDNLATASATKADKVSGATSGNVASLNSSGNLQDSGLAVTNITKDVITTEGDLILGNGSGEEARLAIGSSNTVLRSNGTTASWGEIQKNDIATNAVGQSQIEASAVGQGELKSTSGTVGSSGASLTDLDYVLPGGEYGFYAQTNFSYDNDLDFGAAIAGIAGYQASPNSNDAELATITRGNWGRGNTRAAYIMLKEDSSSSTQMQAQQRYVQASPPYDHGDGEIALFVYVLIHPDGTRRCIYAAPEAPWHLNGPTDTRAKRINAKRVPVRDVREVEAECWGKGQTLQEHLAEVRATGDVGRYREVLRRLREDPIVEAEITQWIKAKDRDLIPAPIARVPNGSTLVLLDPPATEELLTAHEAGENILNLVNENWITIDNTPITRKGMPHGVAAHNWRWKLSSKDSP